MGPAGIELATHNYFIQVTLRFQIRATHAYNIEAQMRLDLHKHPPPPPPTRAPPPSYTHTHQ